MSCVLHILYIIYVDLDLFGLVLLSYTIQVQHIYRIPCIFIYCNGYVESINFRCAGDHLHLWQGEFVYPTIDT